LPTTSEEFLGTEKFGIGPTVVALKQSGHWTFGGLGNHIWSFEGDDRRADVNQTFLQPFLAYGTSGGVTFTVNSESTANWEAPDGDEWTIPIHFVLSKVVKLGKRPMSVGAGVGYFVEGPEGTAEWKVRAFLTLLFPK
jgi:hypothetical protein